MWIRKNQKLFFSAFQNPSDQRASPNSMRKLSRPTKVCACSTVRNSESCKVPNSGRIITAV